MRRQASLKWSDLESRERHCAAMIPTTTTPQATSPSKSRRRPKPSGSASLKGVLFGGASSSREDGSGRNGNGRRMKTWTSSAMLKRSGSLFGGRTVDVALVVCLACTLWATRLLLARQDAIAGSAPRLGSMSARRLGPRDASQDTRLSAGDVNATLRTPSEAKSFYGRAEPMRTLPGFPKTPPMVLSSKTPKAYFVRNFLSNEECDHLIKLAKRGLAPSTVVGSEGSSVSSQIRTSAGMFLRKKQDNIVSAIEQRIARLSGFPEENGEGMQILRYDKGQKYDAHYDYFHDAVNSSPKRGGQRVATVLIYLADTIKGGETIFPNGALPENFEAEEPNNPFAKSMEHTDCVRRGIPVKSVRGDAVLFFSLTETGALDNGALHGACPVIEGQKWTAVKWIRIAEFDGGFKDELPMVPLTRRTDSNPCVDEWDECADWALDDWCERNPEFMTSDAGGRDSKAPACAKSCGLCS